MEKGLIPVSERVLAILADVKVDLGGRCVLLRRRFSKTLADVSVATGIHQHRLSEMERGVLRKVDVRYTSYIEALIENK